jgi:hypothetical protein
VRTSANASNVKLSIAPGSDSNAGLLTMPKRAQDFVQVGWMQSTVADGAPWILSRWRQHDQEGDNAIMVT